MALKLIPPTILSNSFAVISAGNAAGSHTTGSTKTCWSRESSQHLSSSLSTERNTQRWKLSPSEQSSITDVHQHNVRAVGNRTPFVLLVVVVCLINITTQSSVSGATGSRPIVILHGLGSSAAAMAHVFELIQLREPDRLVITLSCLQGRNNLLGIDQQVDILWRHLNSVEVFKTGQGFDFVGHSLGGVIGRAYIHKYNSPHIHRFISIHSPHMGVDISRIDFTSLAVQEITGAERKSRLGKFEKLVQVSMKRMSKTLPVVRDLDQGSNFMRVLNAPLNSKGSHIEQTKLMVLVRANHDRVVIPGTSAHLSKTGYLRSYYRHLDTTHLIFLDHDCGHGIKDAIFNANSKWDLVLQYISAPELDPNQ